MDIPWKSASGFALLTIIALGCDNATTPLNYGPYYTLLLSLGYGLRLWTRSPGELQCKMLHMLWLSFIGEWLFCKGIGLYAYRLGNIPWYVPVGHALVYAQGWLWAQPLRSHPYIKPFVVGAYALLFLNLGLKGDLFSALSGGLFTWAIWKSRNGLLYASIGLFVMYIELVGTAWGCWTWQRSIAGLPAFNPPLGAVLLYAGGDFLLGIISRKVPVNFP